METLKIVGTNNKVIMVKDNTIKIVKRSGMLSTKREKVIPVTNTSGVEVKKPGAVFCGYIQIQIAGQQSSVSTYTMSGGTVDVLKDENAVVFVGDENYKTALEMQRHILNYNPAQQGAAAPLSDADELLKFKKLLDDGVISQEEFAAKKKQILGL